MQRSGAPILVGDVGGTKTVFAMVSDVGAGIQLGDVRTFASKDFDEFDDLLTSYLSAIEVIPSVSVLAVAGPVFDGRASITNLPWHLDEGELETEFGLKAVRLINDLEGLAWSIPHLADSDVVVLQDSIRVFGAPIALIAPGTGLGEAFLTSDGISYVVHATEGGHTDFAPCDSDQDQLLAHLRNKFGHVSVERVCSGDGLANIYRFLIQEMQESESSAVRARIQEAVDITPVIIAAALSEESAVCERAVRIFTDSLAAEAGNFTLKILATGGLYLGGGIPMRILPFLHSPDFINRFTSKGRFSELLQHVPVAVLQDPLLPLRGAAIYGSRTATDWHDKGRHA